MLRSAQRLLLASANGALGVFGLELARTSRHDWSDQSLYIPCDATLAAARKAGLSAGEYIDTVLSKTPGATQSTIDAMEKLGVFSRPMETVLEIGPGSGRYLEKTIARSHPARYEIYETAEPWAAYLVETYPVISRRTDGVSLKETPDSSVDLVHAHKVFSSIDFIMTCCYWPEMARVTRPGGYVVFDLLTENCLDPDTLEKWTATGIQTGSYPAATPRRAATDYFERQGFALTGSCLLPMPPGRTELLAFQKEGQT